MNTKHLLIHLSFCALLLLGSCSYYHINSERVSVIKVGETEQGNALENQDGDEDIERFIAPYAEKLNKAMDEVIGSAAHALNLKKPESPLGNFLADIVQEFAMKSSEQKNNLFSIVNYGGIRINEIPFGNISRGNIYELLPFENMIVIVEMNHAQLLQFINHISARGPWPISKELSYMIDSKSTLAENIKINNKPINESESYYVAMPDYIANGGDDCVFLKALPRESTGLLLRDVVIDYISKSNVPCTAEIDGRITYE